MKNSIRNFIKKLSNKKESIKESTIEKPIIEKPVIEKPVIEKPIIKEPVIEEPTINIYYESHCPICGNTLQHTQRELLSCSIIEFSCSNKCYIQNYFTTNKSIYVRIYVFDKYLTTKVIDKKENTTKQFKLQELEIQKEIEYWKENDKYLINILGDI